MLPVRNSARATCPIIKVPMKNLIPYLFAAFCVAAPMLTGCSTGTTRNFNAAEMNAIKNGPVEFSKLPADQQAAIRKRLAAAMSGGPNRPPQIPGAKVPGP